VALAMPQRPFVFQESESIVGACEGTLQAALQPDRHRLDPWDIVERHFSSFQCR
jgi:hypothetical protein